MNTTTKFYITLEEENADNVRRIQQLLNISATSVMNYALKHSLPELEKYFTNATPDVRAAFKTVIGKHIEHTLDIIPRKTKTRQKAS